MAANVTEVAANLPIANTGKVRLQLRKLPLGPSTLIPVKSSIIMLPAAYEVIALSSGGPVVIANIDYDIRGLKITPAARAVEDARFGVYVNVSER